MKGKLSLMSAIALAGGIGIAAAQSSPPSPSTSPSASPGASNNMGKCYDRLSGQIKDKMAMGDSGPGNKSDNAGMSSTPPGATTGSGSTAAGGTSSIPQRPPAAAGLPDC